LLKVRAVKSELSVSALEREMAQGATYASELEQEITAKQLQFEEGANHALRIEGALQAAEDAARAQELTHDELADRLREQADRFREQTALLDAARKTALAKRVVMRDYTDEIRAEAEARARDCEALGRDVVRAVEQLREYEAQLSESQRHVASAIAERDELRERVADTERLLLDQAESAMAAMQSESAQLALLIDTAQSSRFWKFKRWLSRLRPRSRVRVLR
jgi:chromosome segregation ATPase